ncbi:MAG: hypothetical protein AAGF15_09075 [Pseudomonadota bacterium]
MRFGNTFTGVLLGTIFSTGLLINMPGASAAPTLITDRASFQGLFEPIISESLDTITIVDDVVTLPSGVTITGVDTALSTTPPPARISEGTNSLNIQNFQATDALVFDFASPIIGFGIDFLDAAPLPISLEVLAGGETLTITSDEAQIVGGQNAGPLFIGFSSFDTPLSSVSISPTANQTAVSFDFLQFALADDVNEVPAPAMLGIFGLSLVGINLRGRRR